jgi:hypothetical protein
MSGALQKATLSNSSERRLQKSRQMERDVRRVRPYIEMRRVFSLTVTPDQHDAGGRVFVFSRCSPSHSFHFRRNHPTIEVLHVVPAFRLIVNAIGERLSGATRPPRPNNAFWATPHLSSFEICHPTLHALRRGVTMRQVPTSKHQAVMCEIRDPQMSRSEAA